MWELKIQQVHSGSSYPDTILVYGDNLERLIELVEHIRSFGDEFEFTITNKK